MFVSQMWPGIGRPWFQISTCTTDMHIMHYHIHPKCSRYLHVLYPNKHPIYQTHFCVSENANPNINDNELVLGFINVLVSSS